jgi:hypothetical protein
LDLEPPLALRHWLLIAGKPAAGVFSAHGLGIEGRHTRLPDSFEFDCSNGLQVSANVQSVRA